MKKLTPIFLVTAFLIVFGIGFVFGKNQVYCKVCAPEQVDFSLFWDAWSKIHEKYVSPDKLDAQKMIYGAISGMINSIGDPYTTFFDPPQAKNFLDDVSGSFEGIGIEIGVKKGQLQVISPLEGTPAKIAGLRSGDKIVKINNNVTTDFSIEEAVKLIKGPKGTEVTLTIFREGWQNTKDFKIKRAVIKIPSLKWEIISDNKDIAYIRIYQFSEISYYDFQKAANEILNSQAKKIILDLRDNPGGYLEVSQDIAGWFLEKGQIVVTEDFKQKRDNIVFKTQGNSKLFKYPMAVLINQGSASASEILAAALKENRGVKLIGQTSYGKGSVQELEYFRDKSSLKITVANWLTPDGNQISGVGIKPDIEIENTEKDFEANKDPQLDKAIEIIKGL